MTEYLELNTSNCMHCYKCIRNCPVKAISFSDNQANILTEECIVCGRCYVACPQKAKRIRNDVAAAKALIAEGATVVASLAPSFVANYPGVSLQAMKDALAKLGFADAQETALGATMVKERYDQMVNSYDNDVIISSCCHSINLLIQRHYPAALPYLAPVLSPMQAHCEAIKKERPEAKTVFIGPCVSKKAEAEQYPGAVDCVLTFAELRGWMEEAGIAPYLEPGGEPEMGGRARLFPTTGGILRTMKKENFDYSYISVDGIENCLAALKDVVEGNVGRCFIEMSACAGSCVGGPVMEPGAGVVRNYSAVDARAGLKDFEVAYPTAEQLHKSLPFEGHPQQHFSEKAIAGVLRQIGKTAPEHELNCGSCGYDTCRDKAVAVLMGKADLNMCLPYLMSKAKSFSDTIINNTPNGIVVVDAALNIQQMNAAACQMVGLQEEGDLIGRSVVCVFDPTPFAEVLETGKNQYEKRVYLAEYDRTVMQTVIRDENSELIIGLMRDVTREANEQAAKKQLSEATIAVTDKVIEKQMRTVQEIASLLGETTAETKIALTKLKETLYHDE